MHHILLSSACPVRPNFFTVSHKQHDIQKNVTVHKMCVFWFPLQFLSETFLTLGKIQHDTIINLHKASCKVLVILVRL